MSNSATGQMFYIKKKGEKGKGQLAVGVQNAYEICDTLTNKTLPPLDMFSTSLEQSWFNEAFDIKITPAKIESVTDELERVQTDYEKHNQLAIQLKSQRTALIQASLSAGADIKEISQISGQTVFTIENIASDMNDLPIDTQRELEQAVEEQKVEAAKRRLKLKDAKPKNKHEQAWIHKWQELKQADKQRRESKKNHNGDEWFGTDITEDAYDQLKREVDTMLF